MKEKDKQIIELLKEVLPHLSDLEKERFMGFGEGLIYKIYEPKLTKE